VGDELLVFAPTVDCTGVSYGVDFVPPAQVEQMLLAGDETAAPAIAVILEQLPPTARLVARSSTPARRTRLSAQWRRTSTSRLLPPRFRRHIRCHCRASDEHLPQTIVYGEEAGGARERPTVKRVILSIDAR
jgi:NADPH-dependent ferric siderophore reductase